MKLNNYKMLHESDHIGLYEIQYTDRSGQLNHWHMASRDKNGPKGMTGRLMAADAVVIVPLHLERGQLVVIREFRVTLGGFQFGFPAGLVDPGESIQQAVERELFEETGLTVQVHVRQSPVVFTSSGITDESVVMAYVTCKGDPSDKGNSASELIETHFVSPADAKRLCSDQTVLMDVKTWLVLSGFADKGAL